MKKTERLDLIRHIVANHSIETQNELVSLLEEKGLHATQATISRDINEIGILKVPKNGQYIYGLPREKSSQPRPTENVVQKSILSVSEKTAGLEQFLSLNLTPGNSRLIKRMLLERFEMEIFSCLADDDSILLVAKTAAFADRMREEIERWMEKG